VLLLDKNSEDEQIPWILDKRLTSRARLLRWQFD
jgi:hypothetical protein